MSKLLTQADNTLQISTWYFRGEMTVKFMIKKTPSSLSINWGWRHVTHMGNIDR